MAQIRKLQGSIHWLENNRLGNEYDIAIRLRCKETGEYSRIFGGRWNKWEKRYLSDEEIAHQIETAPHDLARERAKLRVHTLDVHRRQFKFIMDFESRLIMVISGRRGGKSRGSGYKGLVNLVEKPGIGGQIVCPSFPKSKIMWAYMLKGLPYEWIDYINTTEKFIRLHNGASVQFMSAHKPDSLIGEGIGWQAFDESQSISDQAIELAMPALSDGGEEFQVWHTGTPRLGVFRTRCERFRVEGKAQFYRFPSEENPFIETGEGTAFALAKSIMDPGRYAREIQAKWESEEGLVYYLFDRETHCESWPKAKSAGWAKDITKEFMLAELDYECDFVIGVDYGTNRNFATVLKVVEVNGKTGVFAIDEIALHRDSDVHTLGTMLNNRGYSGAAVFDDATGQHSKGGPSASKRLEKLGFEMFHRRKNPPVMARIDAINGLMRNADGAPRFFVDADKCPELCLALENQELVNGKPDKSADLDHMPDSAGYPIFALFKPTIGFEQMEQRAA